MQRFMHKYTRKITGTIACIGRILFKGYLSTCWGEFMEQFMNGQDLLVREFKRFVFVTMHSERLKEHAGAIPEKTARPYMHLKGETRKEKQSPRDRPLRWYYPGAGLDPCCGGRLCPFVGYFILLKILKIMKNPYPGIYLNRLPLRRNNTLKSSQKTALNNSIMKRSLCLRL